MSGTRHVLVLVVDGCHSLNVFGPLEVFYGASIEVPGAYDVLLVGPTDGGIVRTDTGVPLGVAPLPEPPPRHDTLVIAGAAGMVAGDRNHEVVDWVARASRRARRTVSVCTGAFLLAAAGVLDDRPAVTHWAYCAELQRQAPVRRTGSRRRRRRNRGRVHRHAHRPAGDACRRGPADRSGGPHHDGLHTPLPRRHDHHRASDRRRARTGTPARAEHDRRLSTDDSVTSREFDYLSAPVTCTTAPGAVGSAFPPYVANPPAPPTPNTGDTPAELNTRTAL